MFFIVIVNEHVNYTEETKYTCIYMVAITSCKSEVSPSSSCSESC